MRKFRDLCEMEELVYPTSQQCQQPSLKRSRLTTLNECSQSRVTRSGLGAAGNGSFGSARSTRSPIVEDVSANKAGTSLHYSPVEIQHWSQRSSNTSANLDNNVKIPTTCPSNIVDNSLILTGLDEYHNGQSPIILQSKIPSWPMQTSQHDSITSGFEQDSPCLQMPKNNILEELFPDEPQHVSALQQLFDSSAKTSGNRISPNFADFVSSSAPAEDFNSEDTREHLLPPHDVDGSFESTLAQEPENSLQPNRSYRNPNNAAVDFAAVDTESFGIDSDSNTDMEDDSNISRTISEKPAFSQQLPQYQLCRLSNHSLGIATGQCGSRNPDLDGLRSVSEIPIQFRSVFSKFPFFNIVQSRVFDDVMYTDKSLAICAPTGSGKTVIFELAIVRLMMNSPSMKNDKIIYMAPIKALCSERFADWQGKFGPLGLSCCELTGDSDSDDFRALQQAHLVFTTPEKWDSMTRRWRDYVFLASLVKIIFVDEVHLLNDPTRGATIEVVVSRMKMTSHATGLRLLAVSATVPNINDIAEWLRVSGAPQPESYKMSEELRPVKLRQVVLGFYCQASCKDFQFDLSLSYKLGRVIEEYSQKKPTLVFCSTRKGVMHTAAILAKAINLVPPGPCKERLTKVASSVRDSKLRELLVAGVGYHHAGLDFNDRKLIEEVFCSGNLPVLISTGTLAMGVNMPAHLVVIKSTMQYCDGKCCEYSETQLLQMIGRAGRPQFDTTATAVIMTKMSLKTKYESLLSGTQIVESSLHKNLAENLNAEIVLRTITDISLAMDWIRSTFLYIRVFKNPQHYGYPADIDNGTVEKKLQDLCLRELKSLASVDLINLSENGKDLSPTAAGRLMANYCVTLATMGKFSDVKGSETLEELLELVASCHELSEVQLRVTDKKTLNALNADKTSATIRFPMKGKIRSREMKINCLIQANFGCLPIQDVSLNQESGRIMRIAQRLSKCLSEYLSYGEHFAAYSAALTLAQCFRAKLWENSVHVARQIHGIGHKLSTALVNAGITTIEKLRQSQPRHLEMIMNRQPPFGNNVMTNVAALPHYELSIKQVGNWGENYANVSLGVRQVADSAKDAKRPTPHVGMILVGDADGKLVFKRKLVFSGVGEWSSTLKINRAENADELTVNIICDKFVGLDVRANFTPSYLTKRCESTKPLTLAEKPKEIPKQIQFSPGGSHRDCNHRCADKSTCAHDCCKNGVAVPVKSRTVIGSGIGKFFNTVATNADKMPQAQSEYWANNCQQPKIDNLSKFRFTRNQNSAEPPRVFSPETPNFNLELEFIDDDDDEKDDVVDGRKDEDDGSVIIISDDDDKKSNAVDEVVIQIDSDPDWAHLLDDDTFDDFEPPLPTVLASEISPFQSAFRWKSPVQMQQLMANNTNAEDEHVNVPSPNQGPNTATRYPTKTDFVPASVLYYGFNNPVDPLIPDNIMATPTPDDRSVDNGTCDEDNIL